MASTLQTRSDNVLRRAGHEGEVYVGAFRLNQGAGAAGPAGEGWARTWRSRTACRPAQRSPSIVCRPEG